MDHFSFRLREIPLKSPHFYKKVEAFLSRHKLNMDSQLHTYYGVFRGERMVGGAGYSGNVIKCVAVEPEYRGEGILNALITKLRTELHQKGYHNTFLFTKPEHHALFRGVGFSPVEQTDTVLLMESDSLAFPDYLKGLSALRRPGMTGAIVMNCNPFTTGHQYLIEWSHSQCDHLIVFAVEEDRSVFPFSARIRLMEEGTKHLPNVTVVPGGAYIISSATFPTYFLKEDTAATQAYTQLDISIFGRHIAPAAGITARFAGEEPNCPVTRQYNSTMAKLLPGYGIKMNIIPRKAYQGNVVSASRVRDLLSRGNWEEVRHLVPQTTYQFLASDEAAPILRSIAEAQAPLHPRWHV